MSVENQPIGSRELPPKESRMERAGTAPAYIPEQLASETKETGESIITTPEEPILTESILKSANSLRRKIRKLPDSLQKNENVKKARKNLRKISQGKITTEKEAKRIIEEAKKIIDEAVLSGYINQGLTAVGDATEIPLTQEQIKKHKKDQIGRDIVETTTQVGAAIAPQNLPGTILEGASSIADTIQDANTKQKNKKIGEDVVSTIAEFGAAIAPQNLPGTILEGATAIADTIQDANTKQKKEKDAKELSKIIEEGTEIVTDTAAKTIKKIDESANKATAKIKSTVDTIKGNKKRTEELKKREEDFQNANESDKQKVEKGVIDTTKDIATSVVDGLTTPIEEASDGVATKIKSAVDAVDSIIRN